MESTDSKENLIYSNKNNFQEALRLWKNTEEKRRKEILPGITERIYFLCEQEGKK